jgi:hypothetical protein
MPNFAGEPARLNGHLAHIYIDGAICTLAECAHRTLAQGFPFEFRRFRDTEQSATA